MNTPKIIWYNFLFTNCVRLKKKEAKNNTGITNESTLIKELA